MAVWLASSGARAQQVDARGFTLAAWDADARDPMLVQRPGAFDARSAFVGGLFGYAKAPVVAVPAGGDPVSVLDNVFSLDLSAGFAPHDRVRLDLMVPTYGFTGFALNGESNSGLGVADARLAVMVVLLRPRPGEGFGLGLVPHVDLPTGRLHAWFGRERFAGGGTLAATWENGPLTLTADAGVQFETTTDIGSNVTSADALTGGFAAGLKIDDGLGVNAEIHGQLPFAGPTVGATDAPFEAVVALRYADAEGAHFAFGGATGITEGLGAASFRVFLGGGFGAGGGSRDRDDDGLPDTEDACPGEAEVRNGFLDEDGCPDMRPSLRAWASYGGAPAVGASLRIDGPVRRDLIVGAAPFAMDVDPGSVWKGTAKLGPCLVGEQIVTAAEGSFDLEVELELAPYGVAWVRLSDTAGQSIAGAQVTFVPSPGTDANCSPSGSWRTDAAGEVRVPVGRGTHQVRVRVGDRAVSGRVTAEEGREVEVFILVPVVKP